MYWDRKKLNIPIYFSMGKCGNFLAERKKFLQSVIQDATVAPIQHFLFPSSF